VWGFEGAVAWLTAPPFDEGIDMWIDTRIDKWIDKWIDW